MQQIWKLLIDIAGKILALLGIAANISLAAPILAGSLAVSAVIGTGLAIKQMFTPKVTTATNAQLIATFPADKLYTSYAIVPAIFLSYDSKTGKSQVFDYQLEKDKTLTGYCSRKYEVGIGYKNVSDYFNNQQFRQAACENHDDQLPPPEILSKSTKSSNALGDFDMVDCDKLDSNETYWFVNGSDKKAEWPVRETYIRWSLDSQAKAWATITRKSQGVLGTFMRISCPLTTTSGKIK